MKNDGKFYLILTFNKKSLVKLNKKERFKL